MRLYVIRHAKAKHDSGPDRERPLRKRGVRQCDHLAQCLAESDEPPELIVTSPYVRARDTADRIAAAIDCDVTEDTSLEVDEPVSDVLDLIAGLGQHASIALVGHNPQLEYLVAVLVRGPGGEPPRVRTGEAVVLDVDPENLLGRATPVDTWRFEEKSE